MKYFITLSILLFSNLVLAQGRIEIATEDQNGVRWIDFYAEDIPASYGMELEVFYSNDALSVVDTNDRKSGPQILKGDFFSESAYEISNNVDVRAGRIRYAISLLKPAEPVSGNGHLARIGFVTKSDKALSINIANIKFGTREGTAVEVTYPASILVEPAFSVAQAPISTGFKPVTRKLEQKAVNPSFAKDEQASDNLLIIGLLGLIGFLLLIVIVLLARRQPAQAS